MITIEKLNVYEFFKGERDGLNLTGTKYQKTVIRNEDWSLIKDFIQDLRLIKNGLASESYIMSINKNLKENCDTENTIEKIKRIAVK